MHVLVGCLLLFGGGWLARLFFRKVDAGPPPRDASAVETAPQAARSPLARVSEMRVDELFGAAIRVLGVWNIAGGFWWIPGTIILLYDLSQSTTDPALIESIWRELGTSALRLTAGIILFFAADRIVRIAYPRPAPAA